jgi:hypothetical protein
MGKRLMAKNVDYSDFFYMHDPLANRPLRLSPQQDWIMRENENIEWLLFYGELQPPEPVIFKAYMGGQATDFLWSGLVALVCISQRVVDLLRDNALTGWATYPVEVYGRQGEHLPGYYGFAVTSYAGEQDLSRSQIVTRSLYGKPVEMYKGLYFSESSWDGSDIFRVGPGTKVVTGKVQRAFKRAKISNVRFTPVLEDETEVSIFQYRKKQG